MKKKGSFVFVAVLVAVLSFSLGLVFAHWQELLLSTLALALVVIYIMGPLAPFMLVLALLLNIRDRALKSS
jgi:hypothetical protein